MDPRSVQLLLASLLILPADHAVVWVLTTAGKPATVTGSKVRIDAVVADYRADDAMVYPSAMPLP